MPCTGPEFEDCLNHYPNNKINAACYRLTYPNTLKKNGNPVFAVSPKLG